MNINNLLKQFKDTVVNNSPLILTYISVAGVFTTAILAVKATPKAMYDLEFARNVADEELKPLEVAAATWKNYIPAAITASVTVAAIVSSNHINGRRNAAIVSLYSIADSTLKEYQEKVKLHIGDSKEKKVRDEIAKDHLMSKPMATSEVFITGMGEQLCYDSFTGRYFKSDIETIRKAQNDINAKLFRDMYASHNDFYKLIGLAKTTYGEEVGWTLDNQMQIEFSSHLAEDGRPCLCLEYHTTPKTGYYEFG